MYEDRTPLTKEEADKLIIDIIKRVPNDKNNPMYGFIYMSGDFSDEENGTFESDYAVFASPHQAINLIEGVMRAKEGMAQIVIAAVKSYQWDDTTEKGMRDLLDETLGKDSNKN